MRLLLCLVVLLLLGVAQGGSGGKSTLDRVLAKQGLSGIQDDRYMSRSHPPPHPVPGDKGEGSAAKDTRVCSEYPDYTDADEL
ncbi:hypothetical protein KIPB_013909, partial [Kipferlia bialata]|eukprot:g13909.t1